MAEILHVGERLQLRKADLSDLGYIMKLEYEPENLKFIVPFDRDFHTKLIRESKAAMDIIVEERETGSPVGYLMINGLTTEAKEIEWTHVIIEKKGVGYGHEAMKLLKAWSFDDLKFHRAWMDCKDYNVRALHLYESEGMVREGLIRETILTNGVYENLVILGILDREYQARKEQGLELPAKK
ncbi:GNAT family N-acetyltransferase [Selenomonas sp. ND2010]|uniref:GNAT family N-acetyltransferase n=1 Tax=Selenomonas sp. ND2010 TaxID=1410618 RepID=UPI00051AD70D|nr:GNAT family protein [Selenomonas sp. ND2010]